MLCLYPIARNRAIEVDCCEILCRLFLESSLVQWAHDTFVLLYANIAKAKGANVMNVRKEVFLSGISVSYSS